MSDPVFVEVVEQTAVEIVGGIPGAAGAPGAPGSAPQAYTHTQGSPLAVWTVAHNLGYRPAGSYVEDSNGDEHEPAIHHIDENNLTLTFVGALAGFAIFS